MTTTTLHQELGAYQPGAPADAVLIYHSVGTGSASTITEHINAFSRSAYRIRGVNVGHGYPADLDTAMYPVVILHYSVFGIWPYSLNEQFLHFLDRHAKSYTIAFFQDEYRHCRRRFEFINRYRPDCIYTLLEPAEHAAVYGRHTQVPRVRHTLPGYVGADLLDAARRLAMPYASRAIDVGYRGRVLDYALGFGGYEKAYIGEMGKLVLEGRGLALDIETAEGARLYGDAWHRFMANCKCMLGSESGVSIFDLDDRVHEAVALARMVAPGCRFDDLWDRYLRRYEDNIYYRTISPRHFEAAAFGVCQILFEGHYSGLMEPMVHYIPLKKDFSNIDTVLALVRTETIREQITERCHADLIASGRYGYDRFIADFDRDLQRAGLPIAA